MPDEETPEPAQPNTAHAEDETEQSGAIREDQPSPPATAPKAEKRSDRSLALVSVLASAIVGVGGIIGTVVASKLSVDASIRNQDLQAAEQRAKEDRDNKANSYFKFADAADRYGAAANTAHECARRTMRLTPPPTARPDTAGCETELSDLSVAHFNFLTAKSKVYVYGSERAETQSEEMEAYLPATKQDATLYSFDKERFIRMYKNFMRIVCGELPAEPRASCK